MISRRFVRRVALSAFPALVFPALAVTPGHAQSVPIYDSCKSIHETMPDAPDGNYTLSTGAIKVTVYCHDMKGSPREYINLVHIGQGDNFSQYTAGGASPGSNVRTNFTKLRIDPSTLIVDIGDLTFSTSTGLLTHGGAPVASVPYGVAVSCTSAPDGVGRIDLRDTPFIVNDTFVTGGFQPTGQEAMGIGKQTVDLTGGGYCGWMTPAPAMYNPFNPQPGEFHLDLACAPVQASRSGATCVRYL